VSRLGGKFGTVIVSVLVVEPPVLIAVITYTVAGVTVVGVPDTTPVVGFNASPLGRGGLMVNELAAPPPASVGELGAIGALTEYDAGPLSANVRPDGATSLIVMVSENDPIPPLLDAMIVYACPPSVTDVGVPLTTPVDASMDRPAGSAGSTVNDVAAPPETEGALLATALPFVYTAGATVYEPMTGVESATVNRSGNVSDPPVLTTEIV